MRTTVENSPGRRRWMRRIGIGLPAASAGIVAALALLRPLSVEGLAERLAALPKNRPATEHGLATATVLVPAAGGTRSVAVRHLHVPARSAVSAGPVLLVHGTPGCLLDWTELVFGAGGLAADHDVWALDLAGHGLTPPGTEPVTFQHCADLAAAFARDRGIERAVLVGHSYGGEVAWRAALDHPDLFRGLALIDSAGYRRTDDEWLPEERALRGNPLARWGWLASTRRRVERALAVHYEGALPSDRLEEMALLCANPTNWRAMVELARDENGARESELPNLRVPTLLVWGAADRAYPVASWARRFERDVQDAELVVVADAGHYPHAEQPAAVAAALRDFVGRLP